MKFWDREGNPLELLEWAIKFEDIAYRTVAVDIENEKMVSTIWDGLNPPFVRDPNHPVAIFETAYMEHGKIVDRFRWASQLGAIDGHRHVCEEFLGREPRPEDGLVQLIIERDRASQT